jgi:quercetin dioxygenase-like cupin family protein
VKLVTFEPSREITQHSSSGATIAGIARASGEVGVALLRLDAGGVLGRHPAVGPQLFLVVAGEGRVEGGDKERRPIVAGTAAFWEDGELHETTTETGLTAVIVEAASLELL